MSGSISSAAELGADAELTCDVCIVGSGAGGGFLAAGLAARGLSVVMLEEGSHRVTADFDLQERHAYPQLYQERGTRATADLAISILQGRTVGGGTAVNWTTCFRTPDRVLRHWQEAHGLEDWSAEALAPHFDAVEARLGIAEWPIELINANNRVLWEGCRALGYEVKPLRRNVRGCANTGYCGVGCPVGAKQSGFLTTLPDAVAAGMQLFANLRADRVELDGDRVVAVHAVALDPVTDRPTGRRVTVRAKVTAVCGGAINSPALLLRSGLSEGGVGRRTWLHPVVAIPSVHAHRIDGWAGAPQSVGSHAFFDRGPGKVGFFLETTPLQPMLASTGAPVFGAEKQAGLALLPHTASLIAVCVDGLLPGDEGGTVTLRPDGRPRIDYPIGPALQEAFREAMKRMARIALAAGAREAASLHLDAIRMTAEADVARLDSAPYGANQHAIFTAHQMGGCGMGLDPATSVVDPQLRHHRVQNLFVVDGSVLPSAVGVNPSETIYAVAHRAAAWVAAAV